jgi:uncharacterized membrane protein
MKNVYACFFAAVLLAGCGNPKVDPEQYQVEKMKQAEAIDQAVGQQLAWRSLPDYARGDAKWNAQVGYLDGKAALVRLMASDDRPDKWWIYPDTATGKAMFFREETRGKDGKGVRNLFGYLDTALVFAKAGQAEYSPLNEMDFRMKAAEVNKLMQEVIAAVEADRGDLSKAANEARKQNAQFFGVGNEPGWMITVNPSLSRVNFEADYGELKKTFGYSAPDKGPMGESVYEFRAMDDRLKLTIVSKWCEDASGKALPYTVVAEYSGKSYKGCGVLLQ